eukprot:874187-Rhodomonas_salina.1
MESELVEVDLHGTLPSFQCEINFKLHCEINFKQLPGPLSLRKRLKAAAVSLTLHPQWSSWCLISQCLCPQHPLHHEIKYKKPHSSYKLY